MIALTPERREHIAERLREFNPEIDEAAVQRALFAIWPPRQGPEACSVCGVDLKTRPVLSAVHNSAYSKARSAAFLQAGRPDLPDRLDLPPKTVMRNVHKKPLQLVIAARMEGSASDPKRAQAAHAAVNLATTFLFRFCLDCLDQVKP